ncbi:MAG: cytochrome c-type bioproteinis protein CcmF [Chloroflexi bacterium]|nr:MAG: cytochrome c-type bioproteinis protein CcmF [Chloroflexota bacterium]
MIANLGFGVLVITLVLSLYAIGAAFYGFKQKSSVMVESARLAALLTFPLLTIVSISLIILLTTGRFEYAYVFRVTSTNMPLYLKITALWGGQAGSLLFWCWLLSGFAFAAAMWVNKKEREILPWMTIVTMFTLGFFLILVLFMENPFERIWIFQTGDVVQSLFQPQFSIPAYPGEGMGLNPLLRHPGMVVHPPMLYLGFTAFVIPFGFAVSALITGRTDDNWIKASRKWSLTAWLFLSIGLVLGSRWAYDVLGWGGYWGWDPVEIAAFMPWLTGTAYLHSVMIQERRGIFKRWNVALIILTFCLVIFGTFLTRSGVLSSVHAFSQSAIGPLFFIFISIMFAGSLGLLLLRWGSLTTEGTIKSFFSRESLFLFNNLLFMAIFLICLTGVLFPLFSEIFTGQKVTVGPPFYKSATGPLFGALLLLMGIVPLSAWGSSTARNLGKEVWKPAVFSMLLPIGLLFAGMRQWGAVLALWLVSLVVIITLYDYARSVWIMAKTNHEGIWTAFNRLTSRNRRRYGGYIIHLGVVLMALGIIGIEFFQTQTQGTVKKGDSLQLAGYTLTYEDLNFDKTKVGIQVTQASISLSRNGKLLGHVYPSLEFYSESEQRVTIPGVRSTLEDDLYVILVDWLPVSAEGVTFKVFHNPLINWFWIGSIVFAIGALAALWPDRVKKPSHLSAGER